MERSGNPAQRSCRFLQKRPLLSNPGVSLKFEVWFLENSSGADEKDFLPFIEANEQLKYVGKIEELLDTRFFWMITRKS